MLLQRYVDQFVFCDLSTTTVRSKDFLPKIGAVWAMTNESVHFCEKRASRNFVLGIQTNNLPMNWQKGGFGFFVRFTPYGLSRFTKRSIPDLTNAILDADQVWNHTEQLYTSIFKNGKNPEMIYQVESFLKERFLSPSVIDHKIFDLADTIREDLSSPIYSKSDIPLSTRQIERRFKALIGVNISTFRKIARFNVAVQKLQNSNESSLTSIGYDAGYYDQPQFSKEFKTFSSIRPKNFPKSSSFYRMLVEIAEMKIER